MAGANPWLKDPSANSFDVVNGQPYMQQQPEAQAQLGHMDASAVSYINTPGMPTIANLPIASCCSANLK